MKELPKFEARPLFILPKTISEIIPAEGEFGKFVYEKGKELAETKYNDAPILKVARWSSSKQRVEGCNPFLKILYAEVVEPYGLRPARLADLQKSNKLNEIDSQLGLNTKDTYEDVGFCVVSESKPNEHLANRLTMQIRARGVSLPAITDLNLNLVNDSQTEHGFSVKCWKETQIIPAPLIVKSGNYKSENIDEHTGLPKQLDRDGNKHFYGLRSGLSRLYLDGDLVLGSGWDDLADSGSDGRVRFVKDTIQPKKI